MTETTRRFYDDLADDYHLVYADWDASIARQAAALDALIVARLGAGSHMILDCACGIGTQSIGLTAKGHRVIGTDLSPGALARADKEAAARSAGFPMAAADLRALPFPDGAFEAVCCAGRRCHCHPAFAYPARHACRSDQHAPGASAGRPADPHHPSV